MITAVPFAYLAHVLTIPVRVGDVETRFVFDTGSDWLILDQRLAADAGLDLGDPAVRTMAASDETGHEYARCFTELPGDLTVTGAHALSMANPPVMLQKIIHDGLVGDQFLRNFTTTYDVANSRVIFAR